MHDCYRRDVSHLNIWIYIFAFRESECVAIIGVWIYINGRFDLYDFFFSRKCANLIFRHTFSTAFFRTSKKDTLRDAWTICFCLIVKAKIQYKLCITQADLQLFRFSLKLIDYNICPSNMINRETFHNWD